MNGLDRYGYCRECWCQLPGFPETDDYEHVLCPCCNGDDGWHEYLDASALAEAA